MTSAARKFIVDEHSIRLEERVGFIQADIAEIKTNYQRLDSKVDATRDSVSEVKDSVGALRLETIEGFRAVDRQFSSVEVTLGAINGSLTALHNETRRLSAKIDESRTGVLNEVNALFDRKFFRAISVFSGALPWLAVASAYVQKTSLGLAEVAAVAAGMSVIILLGTFLATRTRR